LISGAVDKLPPENVAIIDANEGRPALPGEHDANSLAGSMETDLAAKILNTLGPVVGPDSVRANVNVEYDPTSAEESQETYDPKAVVAVSTQRSDEQMGGAADAGIPGTSSNVPGASTSPKPATPVGQNTQSTHSESTSYAVSKVVRHVLQPSGRLRRISAAVVVDDAVDVSQVNGKRTENRRKRTADELKQIEQLASAAVGLDTTRGDVLAVQNLAFRQPEIEAPVRPTTAQKVRVIVTDWSGAIRYGLLVLLFLLAYFFILRPVKKQVVLALKDAGASLLAKAQAMQDSAKLPANEQALLLRQKLVDRVKAEPVAAGQLVKSLLSEGKS
jgi:flagellar M-ring protein FliF